MASNSPTPIREDLEETPDETSDLSIPDDEESDTPTPDAASANEAESAGALDSSMQLSPVPTNKRWVRTFAKLLVLLVALGALTAAAVFTWPTINERYIQPVETTAADLTTVQARLDDADGRLDALESTNVDLGARTTELEEKSADADSRLDGVDSIDAAQKVRLDSVEEAIAEQTVRLDNIDEIAEALGTDVEAVNSEAARQVEVTRAVELMSRGRLFLYQANYGLASADLAAARQTLLALPADSDVIDAQRTSEAIERLARAIDNLPAFPVAAAGDLDIAWQTLLGPLDPPGVTTAQVDPTAAIPSDG